jgi:hypothetical protein
MTGWNCQAGGRPLQGPSPIVCEQPDGTALPQPDRPVTNVMPRDTQWSVAEITAVNGRLCKLR